GGRGRRGDGAGCFFVLSGRAQEGGAGAGIPRLSGREGAALAFLTAASVAARSSASTVPKRLPHGWHASLCVVWENRGVILRGLAADGFPSSQIAIVASSAVPLWKVIVGPRADELQTGPARVRFSLCAALRRSLCSLPRCFAEVLARQPFSIYPCLVAHQKR